jgi:multidrug efflux pump subunit AcrA (membrane-fusion protein)
MARSEPTTASPTPANPPRSDHEKREGGETPSRQLGELTARFHESLDVDATAYRIANESRAWLEVDRVTVLRNRKATAHVVAMSGVDRVDRRADLIRTLENLASVVGVSGDILWFDSTQTALAPEIDDRLHAFLEHSPAKTLVLIPLSRTLVVETTKRESPAAERESPIAFLAIESFESILDPEGLKTRLRAVVPHAASALANALQHARVPGAVWFDRVANLDRHWLLTRTGIAAAAIAVVALALAVIPADFKVEARGELQPVTRREIFAPADGVIGDIKVKHGQMVAKDDVLLTLTQSQFDLEMARVTGELQTAVKRLAATQSLRLEPNRTKEDSAQRAHQFSADEEELKELIKSLKKQEQILQSHRSDLTVRSPLAGKVLTWNVEPLLAARPVARGQQLMTVADVTGAWELDLHVPDDRIGHVLNAQQDQSHPLPIDFVTATDPGKVYETTVGKIAQTSESLLEGQPTVQVTATVEPNTIPDPRPGAEVIAQIDCGRRSIGYVWFHDLFDAIRSWIYF